MADLLIHGGKLVSAKGVHTQDILIDAGQIVELSAGSSATAKQEIDARGLHVFAGMIDTHVHFNEPGRANWEGVASGSAALAAGGGTLYFDMPLNSDPPLLNASAFKTKKECCEAKSVTDFALWGGLTPDNLTELDDLAACGVIGFKAFMSNSGIAEFKAIDDLSLYEGMQKAAQLGLSVALHAESDAITAALSQHALNTNKTDARAYLASRPIIAELEAINRALLLAKETNCNLHIVHVSSASGAKLIAQAKSSGQALSAETCAHYLQFSEDDVLRLGAVAKCAPPLRSQTEQDFLWQAVLENDLDMIASDHSPSDPTLKESTNFFEVWGGVSGVQSTLNMLLTKGKKQGLSLEKITTLTAANPAERFKLNNKGNLKVGFDADLCLIDLTKTFTLTKEQLFYKHKQSPYVGETFQGVVRQTLLRGQTVFKNGHVDDSVKAKFITPSTT